MYTASTSGRSSRSTFTLTKRRSSRRRPRRPRSTRGPSRGTSGTPSSRPTAAPGTSRRRASANASGPHGYQSTGLSRCWRRYGDVSPARRFTAPTLPSGSARLSARCHPIDRLPSLPPARLRARRGGRGRHPRARARAARGHDVPRRVGRRRRLGGARRRRGRPGRLDDDRSRRLRPRRRDRDRRRPAPLATAQVSSTSSGGGAGRPRRDGRGAGQPRRPGRRRHRVDRAVHPRRPRLGRRGPAGASPTGWSRSPTELQALGVQLQTTAAELARSTRRSPTWPTTVRDLGDVAGRAGAERRRAGARPRTGWSQRVDDARDRVAVDLWLARLVIVLIGAVLAIGLVLADRRAAADPSVSGRRAPQQTLGRATLG